MTTHLVPCPYCTHPNYYEDPTRARMCPACQHLFVPADSLAQAERLAFAERWSRNAALLWALGLLAVVLVVAWLVTR